VVLGWFLRKKVLQNPTPTSHVPDPSHIGLIRLIGLICPSPSPIFSTPATKRHVTCHLSTKPMIFRCGFGVVFTQKGLTKPNANVPCPRPQSHRSHSSHRSHLSQSQSHSPTPKSPTPARKRHVTCHLSTKPVIFWFGFGVTLCCFHEKKKSHPSAMSSLTSYPNCLYFYFPYPRTQNTRLSSLCPTKNSFNFWKAMRLPLRP
jgi:hypothetical protein